ncbi:MAG: bifunctional riboflavin kinase/FAD synthetase [Actinomycetota bacterium]
MKTVVGLDRLLDEPAGPSAVTVGTFDGVHLGHRALIARTVEEARRRELQAAAITWDRHPMQTLRPGNAPPLLTVPERKVELLAETGIDVLVVLPFDRELSQWAPERFIQQVLVDGLRARAVLVGEGWRFGHRAAGDVDLLSKVGPILNFQAHGIPLAEAGGGAVSSSRIRELVAAGDMEDARALLGRPFDLQGPVVHGDDRGAGLGWPTANVELDRAVVAPARGVYAGRAVPAGGEAYAAAVNVGVNPTFGGDPALTAPRVEAYLLDFEGDLYGRILRVELWKRLRDELRFASAAELTDQIARDVADTRLLVG